MTLRYVNKLTDFSGAGKTHIAAYISQYHFMKAKYEDKKFLALFIVPIRPLAEQQGSIFEGVQFLFNFGVLSSWGFK